MAFYLGIRSWRYGVRVQVCPTASGAGRVAASTARQKEKEEEEETRTRRIRAIMALYVGNPQLS